MEKVIVVGAGVMGSALAIHLGNNQVAVNLWGTKWDEKVLKDMESTKRHSKLEANLPESISLFYEEQLEEAFEETKLIIIAVSSKGIESICKTISPYLNEEHIILSVTKGIDEDNLYTMSNVIENALPEELRRKVSIVKLGGPIRANEIANAKYTEGVFASKNIESAKYAQKLFNSSKFKGGISADIEGVELCAAFKNAYAITMGIVEGLEGDVDNPKAALMARGAVEMANIVEAYNGSRETALGIAGVGDYYVTAQGGRNRTFGVLLGKGKTKAQAMDIMENQTVEGITATYNGYKLLKKLESQGKFNIREKAPLFQELYWILYEGKPVEEAINSYWESKDI